MQGTGEFKICNQMYLWIKGYANVFGFVASFVKESNAVGQESKKPC